LFGFEEAYWFQEGRIMSPADLSVGSHRLVVVQSDEEHPLRIRFLIEGVRDAQALGVLPD
jgi:hypothetical protein